MSSYEPKINNIEKRTSTTLLSDIFQAAENKASLEIFDDIVKEISVSTELDDLISIYEEVLFLYLTKSVTGIAKYETIIFLIKQIVLFDYKFTVDRTLIVKYFTEIEEYDCNESIIAAFVDSGIELVNHDNSKQYYNLLMIYLIHCTDADPNVVKYLIKGGIDPNEIITTSDNSSFSALMLATRHMQSVEVLQTLIDLGTNIYTVNLFDDFILFKVLPEKDIFSTSNPDSSRSSDILKFFITRGIDITCVNEKGKNILLKYCSMYEDITIIDQMDYFLFDYDSDNEGEENSRNNDDEIGFDLNLINTIIGSYLEYLIYY